MEQHPRQHEKQNRSAEGVALTPMDRFRSLGRRLSGVTKEEMAEQERIYQERKAAKTEASLHDDKP